MPLERAQPARKRFNAPGLCEVVRVPGSCRVRLPARPWLFSGYRERPALSLPASRRPHMKLKEVAGTAGRVPRYPSTVAGLPGFSLISP